MLSCLFGDQAEKAVAEELLRAFPDCSDILGGMSLLEWQQKMSEMAAVIAVDSMGLHLCGLTGTPAFSIFGPTSAKVFRPPDCGHGSFQADCPYRVSFVQQCPRLRSCSSGACLKEIDAEKLAGAFLTWWKVPQRAGTEGG